MVTFDQDSKEKPCHEVFVEYFDDPISKYRVS